ncbi:MAG TPA: aminopeptidase, partial [Lysobacter sp.]|nr:aminopeptidase [Lysobacter sp.]
MRSSILTLCFAAAVVLGGCSRDAAPATDTAAKPDAVTAPGAEYDSLSYAEPDKVRIKDLALALDVDFDARQISGSATYDLDWVDPEATGLVLDTRDLTIEKVVGERSDGKWVDLKYELADADKLLGSKLSIQAPERNER